MEEVYNCRVAEFHTYFVGGEGVGVWAHNSYQVPEKARLSIDSILTGKGSKPDAVVNLFSSPGTRTNWKAEGSEQGLADRDPIIYIVTNASTGELLKVGESANWKNRFEQYKTSANSEGIDIRVYVWKVPGASTSSQRRRLYEKPAKQFLREQGERLNWEGDSKVFKLKLNMNLPPDLTLSLADQGIGGWATLGRQSLTAHEPLVYVVRNAQTQDVLRVGETSSWQSRFGKYVTEANTAGIQVEVLIWRLSGKPHADEQRQTYWEAPLAFYYLTHTNPRPTLAWDDEVQGRNILAEEVDW